MPVYEYRGLNSSGKTLKGILDAESDVAAREKLRSSGIFPVEVKETLSKARDVPTGPGSLLRIVRGVKAGEVSAMTRQLSTLLGAGVPLVRSLESIIAQMSNPQFKRVVAQIKESVNQGNSLAFSLSQHPRIFSNVYVNMVQSGEASGSLDVVLDRLAEHGEHQQALRGRFRAALAYPIFMFFVGAVVLFVLITFIVPNITRIFSEMRQALPLPTVVLIKVGDFLSSYWWVIALCIVVAILAFRNIKRRPRVQHFWDKRLLQSGVPLVTGLQIVGKIVDNSLIEEVIDTSVGDIQEGQSLAGSLSQSPWFSSIAVQMISVGEQSGELEAMLHKIADTQEREVESRIMALTSMLEPVMILVMAVVVAFIVFSILLPILEMSQIIR